MKNVNSNNSSIAVVPMSVFMEMEEAHTWQDTWEVFVDHVGEGPRFAGGFDHAEQDGDEIIFYDRGVSRNGRTDCNHIVVRSSMYDLRQWAKKNATKILENIKQQAMAEDGAVCALDNGHSFSIAWVSASRGHSGNYIAFGGCQTYSDVFSRINDR